jgi:site-specific recombinase XerD
MIHIPNSVFVEYEVALKQRQIPSSLYADYKKWLLQGALYHAVRKAKIPKKVTAHTFRHYFATHLLQANYDIRTIQTLLGYSSLKTTMIYTHCVPVRTVKEAKSPLDF